MVNNVFINYNGLKLPAVSCYLWPSEHPANNDLSPVQIVPQQGKPVPEIGRHTNEIQTKKKAILMLSVK